MMAQTDKITGVLGRGPAFWAVMVFLSTALVLTLAFTEAVENYATLMLITAIPCALAMVMFRAGYKSADVQDNGCAPGGEAQKRYISAPRSRPRCTSSLLPC